MNKRVLSMLSAGVMAASTLLPSVPAFAANTGSGYVLMNIPYSVFYSAQDADVQIDAVSAATGKINSTALAKGGYADADNNIKGVTLPVYVEDLSALTGTEVNDDDTLEVSWTARGKQNTDTLEGSEVLLKSGDYAYYVLDEEPAVYADLTVKNGSYSISALKGGTKSAAVADAKIADGDDAHHTSYEISGTETEDGTIYGAVLKTKDGSSYALRHISGIWRNMEYGFEEDSFSGIAGKQLTGMTLYTDAGIKYVTFGDSLTVREYPDATVYSEDSAAVYVKGLPEDVENVKVSVYVTEGRTKNYLVEGAELVDGKVVLPDGKVLEEGNDYSVAIASDNYPTRTVTLTFPTAEPEDKKDTDETPSEDETTPAETPSEDKTDDSAATEEVQEEQSSAKHTHNYEWVTTKTATATTDGLMKYRCKKCGAVEYEVPTSAYYVFNKETQEAVKNAAAGATVTVETPIFISFHEMVKEALAERSDVTLVVDYKNAGKSYEMTIPAGSGATLETLFGQDKFAGFLYLGGAFATVEK